MQRVQLVGGVLELYSGIAYGADLMAVETARALGLTVHLVLPKPVTHQAENGEVRQDAGFAADFWDACDPASPKPSALKTGRAPGTPIQDSHWKSGMDGGTLRVRAWLLQRAFQCYYDAGLPILEACDVFVAVWDGEAAQGLGGTRTPTGGTGPR